MSIQKLIVILLFATKGVIGYSQSNDTLLRNLFNNVPVDSSREAIVFFIQKSKDFDNVKIYPSEESIKIRGSIKNIKSYKYKADTAFIESNNINDLIHNSKIFSIAVIEIFESRKKARSEFKTIKKKLDQIIDSSLRNRFTINDSKFLNYRYQLTKDKYYPKISISLETEDGLLYTKKKFKVLRIKFEKESQ